MAQGRFEEAIPIYRKLVAAVPGNPGLVLNLGMAQQMAGHPQDAIPNFETVLTAQPGSIPALTSLGMAELQLNRPRQAISPLEKLLRLEPRDTNARGMLAGAYLSLNQPAQAAEQYRKLTQSTVSDPKAWYGLGKSYESLAGDTFARLSKIDGQSPYVAALLGDSRLGRRQFRSAFFFYRDAEKKQPDLPGLHAGLAKVYEGSHHEDWAVAERKLENSNRPCAAQTAECRFLRGDLLEAAAAARIANPAPADLFWATRAYNQLAIEAFAALGKLPESVEIHALKAQILHGHGQDGEAVGEWRAALAMAPENERLKTELATSLFLAHNYNEAMPLLRQLLANQRGAADLNFMLGESLWRTQQPEEALRYLQTSLQTDPDLAPAQAALGMVLVLLNRNAEAVPYLEKAAAFDNDGSLHYSLARACQATGQTEKAKEAMQQYGEIKRRNQQIDDQLAREAEITAPVAP